MGKRRYGGQGRRSVPLVDWRRIPESDRPLGLVGRKHPALTTRAELVNPSDAAVLNLAVRMAATLRAHGGGMALAACQVGVAINLVVSHDRRAYVNVHVEDRSRVSGSPLDETETALEGCLSIPGRWYAVPRRRSVRVVAIDLATRQARRLDVTDLDARMWQHEADHLNGVLISTRWPESSEDRGTPLPRGAVERLAAHVEEQRVTVETA